MIDAIKALNLMPSVQHSKYLREKRFDEISNAIEQAARNDKDNIIISVYDYEEYYIVSTLKDRGFRVNKMPYTEETDGNNYRFKYLISWR